MIRYTLVILSLVMLLTSTVQAQSYRSHLTRDHRWEFSIQTRYTADQTYDGEGGSSLKLEEDLGWGFGFGYNLSQHWYLGMIVSWRTIPYTAIVVDASDPDSRSSYGGQVDVSTFGFEADWYILQGPLTPYVLGSFGWTLIDTNVYAGSLPSCWWDPWWGPICGNVPATYGKNTVAYNIGAGGRFELSKSFHVRLGYEYNRLDAASISGTSMIRLDIGWRFD